MSTTGNTTLGLPFPPAAHRSGWRRRETELAGRGAELLRQAREILGPELDRVALDGASPGRTAELVSTLTWFCIERLRETAPPRAATARICQLVADLQDLALDLYDHEMVSRTRRIAACEQGLMSLRAIGSSADLVDRACEELARSCGFGRVVLGKVEAGRWIPWRAHFQSDDTDWNSWFEEGYRDSSLPLHEMNLETQLIAERRPGLVHDTSAGVVPDIIRDGMSTSYVIAPIMPAGRVVGFFHADLYPSARRCDEADRDVIWAFAEGFGHIYERTVLLERLRAQREQIRETLGVVEATMRQLSEAEIELAAHPDVDSTVTRTAVSVLTTMSGNVDELTPRELEVLELMVAGAKNQAIAEQLVITEGTVKSHVKHILRKLGAANRSQAIAHYLGMTGGQL